MIARHLLMTVCTFVFAIISIVNVVEAIPFSSSSSSTSSSTTTSASQQRQRRAPPEASSTLLRMHRLYIQQPPHDMTLYDALQVSPNATAAEITKAYRRLSRQFHPDKCHNSHNNNNNSDNTGAAAAAALEKVREAYEVLKDDTRRLPYHRYGLLDMNHAVMILTGHRQSSRHFADDPAMVELLRFVGSHHDVNNDDQGHHRHGLSEASSAPLSSWRQNDDDDEDHRAWRIATDLLEKIRPVIEGRISERALMNEVASECDRLKTLPMGAQILRCVGRAYRYSGRKFLRRFVVSSMNHHDVSKKPSASLLLPLQDTFSSSLSSNNKVYIKVGPLDDFTDNVRDKWRGAKHLMTAAVASGRVLFTEQIVAAKQQLSKKSKQPAGPAIFYEGFWNNENEFGHTPFSTEDADSEATVMSTVDEERIMREREHIKAMNTLLESNQVEALWKVTKIEIDRTIRKACDMILQGQVYFSFPSHQLYHEGHDDTSRHDDMPQHSFCSNDNGRGGGGTGWVGSTGVAIDARVARQRAAAILVMMGDILVQRSKENTSWME